MNQTKLLGYPNLIQGPMETECEMVRRGIYCGRPVKQSDREKQEIADASRDWVLLFRLGTVEKDDFELMFGDCGNIYFWIRRQDLAARNFDKIWLILQCG